MATNEALALEEATAQAIDGLRDALARRDRDAVMACFTDDAVFSPSIGGEAANHHGPAAAADALLKFINSVTSGKSESVRRILLGEEAYSEFKLTGTNADGQPVVVHGCDYFLVRDGKIAIKNAFRKVQPA